MSPKRIQNSTVALIAIAGLLALLWWVTTDPTKDFKESLPGEDNRGKADSVAENIVIGEHFEKYSDSYTPLPESWPRFRGADIDNISKSKIRLKDKFGADGPKILWSLNLGEGHSGAAIYKGLVYVMDYDEKRRADVLRCLSLTDGKEQWQRWYNVAVKRNHGMSRTVPVVTDSFVVTIGPRAQVMCVERPTGNLLWGLDVEKEYQVTIPTWYTGQCPLIDNGKAIIGIGGTKLMVAIDCKTGRKLWETPNPDGYKMSHSSVMPYVFGGRKMYVYCTIGAVCGIAADGPDAGKLLWKEQAWNHSVEAPSPVCMPDGKIFLTAGYGAGSMMIQLSEENGNFKTRALYQNNPSGGLACEQQTPLLYQGRLFGILPKDGGALRNQFVCVDPVDTRKILWSSGKETRFGLGPYFIADNKFFILDDEAVLTILKLSTKEYVQLSQTKIFPDAQDAWAPMALADGYLVLRDSKKMVCIDMRL
jgi:outer membrane protein assembly factor BamB